LKFSVVLSYTTLHFLTMVRGLLIDSFVVSVLDQGQVILKCFDQSKFLFSFLFEKVHIVFFLPFKSSVMLTLNLLNFSLVVFITLLDLCLMLFADRPNLGIVTLFHIVALFFRLSLEGIKSLLQVLFFLIQIGDVTLISLVHRVLESLNLMLVVGL
jgi:hypothetical protein